MTGTARQLPNVSFTVSVVPVGGTPEGLVQKILRNDYLRQRSGDILVGNSEKALMLGGVWLPWKCRLSLINPL